MKNKINYSPPRWMNLMDFFFNKALPKKFIILIIATVLTFLGILEGGQWVGIAFVYAGVNIGQKVLERVTQNGSRIDN